MLYHLLLFLCHQNTARVSLLCLTERLMEEKKKIQLLVQKRGKQLFSLKLLGVPGSSRLGLFTVSVCCYVGRAHSHFTDFKTCFAGFVCCCFVCSNNADAQHQQVNNVYLAKRTVESASNPNALVNAAFLPSWTAKVCFNESFGKCFEPLNVASKCMMKKYMLCGMLCRCPVCPGVLSNPLNPQLLFK